jgi:hypothetical protein
VGCADVGRANKHGIFIAANLYIVVVDFASLSSQSGVCFISNKKKCMYRTLGTLQQLIVLTMIAITISTGFLLYITSWNGSVAIIILIYTLFLI